MAAAGNGKCQMKGAGLKGLHCRAIALVTVVMIASALLITLPGCEKVGKLGEVTSNGKADLTVHSVKFYDQMWSGFTKSTPDVEGGVFAVVDITVKNSGKATFNTALSQYRLSVVGSEKVLRADKMENASDSLNQIKVGALKPGKSTKGTVTFSVTAGAKLDRFVMFVSPTIEVSLNEKKAAMPPAGKLPSIGQPVQKDGVQVTVDKVSNPATIPFLQYAMGPSAGKIFYQIDMTIKNISLKQGYTISARDFFAMNSKGDSAGAPTMSSTGKSAEGNAALAPGEQGTLSLVYSIPPDMEIVKVCGSIGGGSLGPLLEAGTK